jgi:hypothetical protein
VRHYGLARNRRGKELEALRAPILLSRVRKVFGGMVLVWIFHDKILTADPARGFKRHATEELLLGLSAFG